MSNRILSATLLVAALLASLLIPAASSGLGSDSIPLRLPPEEIVLDAEADASTNASQPSSNFGNSATLGVGRAGAKFTSTARTYIGFDVSQLSSELEIVSARLELYLVSFEGLGPFEINASTPAGTWSEPHITWDNQPGVDQLLDKVQVPAAAGYQSWDVTDAVEGWITRRLRNVGLVLTSGEESFAATFHSRESRSLYKPRLVISYYEPVATATPTRTVPIKPPTSTPTRTSTLPFKPPTSTPSITPTPYRTYLPLVLKQIPPG